MPTEDRFWQRRAAGRLVARDDVARHGRYASHISQDGHLYEFDQGRFWRSDLHGGDTERVEIADATGLPTGPWYHLAVCNCPSCSDV